MRTTPLLLLSAFAAAPAFAQDQAPPLRVFVDGGYSQTNERFNGSGDKVGGDIQITTARTGLSYDFMQIGDLGIGAGLRFSAANVEEAGAKSGFKPRDLGLTLHLESPRFGLRAGYIQDLGPDFEAGGSIPNSDNLNAVVVGANAQTFFSPNLRVFGNADYFVTLKGDVTRSITAGGIKAGTEVEMNTGDWFTSQAGVGFRPMEAIELGARLAYQYQAAADDNFTLHGTDVTTGEKSSNFSFIPFVHLNQPGSPFTFYAEGRADREYGPIGYSFSGNNSPKGKTGVVVGLRYAFRADDTRLRN